MNLFIFIFKDYRSCLSEIRTIIVEKRALKERALIQPVRVVLHHTYHAVNLNTLDIFFVLFYLLLSNIIFFMIS